MKTNFFKSNANRILLFLIITDLFFCLAHIIIGFLISYGLMDAFEGQSLWFITTDLSYAEYFQYLKFILIIFVLLELVVVKRNYYFLTWLALFTLLLLDDSFQIHEKMGLSIAQKLNFKSFFGLRPRDFGEFVYASLLGLFFLITFIFAFRKASNRLKQINLDLIFLMALLVFFGIVIDLLHFSSNFFIINTLALIEDGGEMFCLSLIVWYLLLIREGSDMEGNFLYQRIFRPIKKIRLLIP